MKKCEEMCCVVFVSFHFSVSFCYTSPAVMSGSCVREKERRAEKTRKEKKKKESNRIEAKICLIQRLIV